MPTQNPHNLPIPPDLLAVYDDIRNNVLASDLEGFLTYFPSTFTVELPNGRVLDGNQFRRMLEYFYQQQQSKTIDHYVVMQKMEQDGNDIILEYEEHNIFADPDENGQLVEREEHGWERIVWGKTEQGWRAKSSIQRQLKDHET